MNDALNNVIEVTINDSNIRDKWKIVQRIEGSRVECVEKSKSKVRSRVTDLIVLTPYPLIPALSTCSSSCFILLTEYNTRFPRENYVTYTDKCLPAVFRSIWYCNGDGERTSPGGGHVIPSTFHSTNNRHRCFTSANLAFRYHKFFYITFLFFLKYYLAIGNQRNHGESFKL